MEKMIALFLLIILGVGNASADSDKSFHKQKTSGQEVAAENQSKIESTRLTDDTVMKYEAFLRNETKQQLDFIQSWYDRSLSFVGYGGTALITVFTLMGFRNYRQMLRRIEDNARDKTEQQINGTIDKIDKRLRIDIEKHTETFKSLYDRRAEKYQDLIGSVFESIIRSSDQMRKEWLGNHLPSPERLDGLRFLWVDDDPVGIALFIKLLEYYQAKVRVAKSSKEGLNLLRICKFDVVITNVNRFPTEKNDAGIQFAKQLREEGFNCPILIFTRAEHLEGRAFSEQKTEIATNREEFFTKLNLIVGAVTATNNNHGLQ